MPEALPEIDARKRLARPEASGGVSGGVRGPTVTGFLSLARLSRETGIRGEATLTGLGGLYGGSGEHVALCKDSVPGYSGSEVCRTLLWDGTTT